MQKLRTKRRWRAKSSSTKTAIQRWPQVEKGTKRRRKRSKHKKMDNGELESTEENQGVIQN